MDEILLPLHTVTSLSAPDLLGPEEVVAVVDDSPEIVLLLSHYLTSQGLAVVRAGNAHEFYQLLNTRKIALVLLDIELPDQNGNEILKDIAPNHPDLAVIMVTGTTDIQVALSCLRHGADDYLTKPVNIKQFSHTVQSTLQKRRLTINSRLFQQELQNANARMRFLHHLNLKMNTAYLNTVELRGILQAILVGITSEDGLRFNRAFLALFNTTNGYLEGKLAIGPSSREEAGRVWSSIKEKGLQLDDILEDIHERAINDDIGVNQIVKSLRVSQEEQDHVLIHASRTNESIHVQNGIAENCRVPEDLIRILGESSFVVVPLYAPGKALGVMIVDNYITGKPITVEDISSLKIFASQASLAIEHSRLYETMAEKIAALEMVTQELEKNKDLLIEAERTAAVGHMSAQLLHGIRNPLTSIGGTSRLLAKRVTDQYVCNFLNVITQETNKIETILEDLFSYVEEKEFTLENQSIFSIIRKSMMIFYMAMKQNNIEYTLDLDGPGPSLPVNENKIRQAFLHLIKNSVEAMPNGGTLQITAQEEDAFVTISVIDSGPGIPADALPHVKDPFFTTKTYGNGLGLALVDQIIQGHGGRFIIQDGTAGGTVATVSLPKTTSSPTS
ncbi:MAG: response regulator [Proteobacteria bacterium]|nr:response regulator [Pseudomonadota bacterium]